MYIHFRKNQANHLKDIHISSNLLYINLKNKDVVVDYQG